MRIEHENFYNQVKYLDSTNRQLAKKFFKAFDDFNQKMSSFSKTLKAFYFWRVLHLINDLLVFDATEPNLNKFVSDISIEWEFLDPADQVQLRQSFPEFVDRIKSVDFQIFAAKGRKLWSVDRFTHPSN
ncbi:hypothetical protein M3Y97_00629000 [Aphelenchoides bicaudatus]|nr:hypothetical protein M3Y97_00629000 [Aphelenchoides bicaudatus]